MARSKRLNKGMLILSDLKLPALSYVCSTNHCYQLVARILTILCAQNRPVALWEGDFSLSKVYEGPLGYAERSPLTLCNHFIQLYRALDTLFSEHYELLIIVHVKIGRLTI